ncbi:hypothetical protein [Phaeodactylibacter xiamenensis]|uniref:hypothetical protein n=1 Tax=Phaeodactylibacter xiamenensis TaxID=1524460 RepID=UPI0024A80F98|nr:hypothetical protein [Phaeodactylibacter xiamenensis]
MKRLIKGFSVLLIIVGACPLTAQEETTSPLKQLLIWENTQEESLLSVLGETYRPVIESWEACLSTGACSDLPVDKIQDMLRATIEQQLYDSTRMSEQYRDIREWISLDTLQTMISPPLSDSVSLRLTRVMELPDEPRMPARQQLNSPKPFWLQVTDELLINAIEEEAIESAVGIIKTELQQLQETDTLVHILFPNVSRQILNYSTGMPASVALQHFKAALAVDYQQLDARFPYALQQTGRLSSQSTRIIEEGEYWLDRYWQGHIDPPVFPGDNDETSFPVNSWLSFLNEAFEVSANQPLHPITIKRLQESGRVARLCHWWAGLYAPGLSAPSEIMDNLPDNYVQGMISYHRFVRNTRRANWNIRRPELLQDFIQTFLDLRGCFLSVEDALDAEQILSAIANLRYHNKSKSAQHKALMNIAEELALYNHPLLLLLGNLAVQDDLDSFQKVLKEIYLPHASFSSLRKNKRTYLLMGYAGLHSGMETSLHPDRNMRGLHTAMGICAGPALSMGTGKYAHTFLLQIIDLGAPFSFLIKDAEDIRSGQFPEKINLEAFVSPGAGYFLGLKNSPLSLGLSAAMVNNGRTDPGGQETDILRFNLGLYLDFPIYTLGQVRHSFTHLK